MTQLKRIIQLRSEGYNKLSISQKLGIHRKTLNDYLKKGTSPLLGIHPPPLAALVIASFLHLYFPFIINKRLPVSRK
jgi:hypothetical protein